MVKQERPSPWKRFFARSLDLLVSAWVTTAVVYVFFQYYLLDMDGMFIFSVFSSYIAWIPIEALFVSRYGATPSKWLYGISVKKISGENLNYYSALKRALHVWGRGDAFGVPVVNIVARAVSYWSLMRHGFTKWDQKAGSTVSVKKWGVVRVFFVVAITLFVFSISAGVMQSGVIFGLSDFQLKELIFPPVFVGIVVGFVVSLAYGAAALFSDWIIKRRSSIESSSATDLDYSQDQDISDVSGRLDYDNVARENGSLPVGILSGLIVNIFYFTRGLYRAVYDAFIGTLIKSTEFIKSLFFWIIRKVMKLVDRGR